MPNFSVQKYSKYTIVPTLNRKLEFRTRTVNIIAVKQLYNNIIFFIKLKIRFDNKPGYNLFVGKRSMSK